MSYAAVLGACWPRACVGPTWRRYATPAAALSCWVMRAPAWSSPSAPTWSSPVSVTTWSSTGNRGRSGWHCRPGGPRCAAACTHRRTRSSCRATVRGAQRRRPALVAVYGARAGRSRADIASSVQLRSAAPLSPLGWGQPSGGPGSRRGTRSWSSASAVLGSTRCRAPCSWRPGGMAVDPDLAHLRWPTGSVPRHASRSAGMTRRRVSTDQAPPVATTCRGRRRSRRDGAGPGDAGTWRGPDPAGGCRARCGAHLPASRAPQPPAACTRLHLRRREPTEPVPADDRGLVRAGTPRARCPADGDDHVAAGRSCTTQVAPRAASYRRDDGELTVGAHHCPSCSRTRSRPASSSGRCSCCRSGPSSGPVTTCRSRSTAARRRSRA